MTAAGTVTVTVTVTMAPRADLAQQRHRPAAATVRPRSDCLRVASACSGLGTESFALRALGRPHKLILAAEKERFLRTFLRRVHRPHVLLKDCMSRRFLESGSGAQIFVAGFPCQPFSAAGSGGGTSDRRGIVVFALLRWLARHQPACFILENVAGLMHRHRPLLDLILRRLKAIRWGSAAAYSVHWKVVNSRDYGVPQAGWGNVCCTLSC